MNKLNQLLTDRPQNLPETAKAQGRDNLGISTAITPGIQNVLHDSTLTGNGNTQALGLANPDNYASKTWVQGQGYITAQGAELTAGRGIDISEHVISTPSACLTTTSTKVGDTTYTFPITSCMVLPYKGSVTKLDMAASAMGPVSTQYLLQSIPLNDGVYGMDSKGTWQECMTGMPADITANSVTVYSQGPDSKTTATIDAGGLGFTATGKRRSDDTVYTSLAAFNDSDVWVLKNNELYSLTSDILTDSTLKGGGKHVDSPLGLAEDIDHRGTMQYLNAGIYQHGLGITAGNVRSTALYTSTQPMSGQYLLSWGARGHSTNMWGNGFFIRVSVGPDWGKSDSQGNYAFGGYDWYTQPEQGIGMNTCEILGGTQMVYLTGQTSINISMYFCSAWNAIGTPNYVNGSWAGMSEFHTGHWLSNVWVTLDKVGPYAGPRTNKYR